MYLYNTTFAVESDLENEVVEWIKKDFIPSATEDEYFLDNPGASPHILRVLGGEPGVTSLAVHLFTESIEDIEKWYSDHGSRLFGSVIERWQSRVMFFSTTLEVLYAG